MGERLSSCTICRSFVCALFCRSASYDHWLHCSRSFHGMRTLQFSEAMRHFCCPYRLKNVKSMCNNLERTGCRHHSDSSTEAGSGAGRKLSHCRPYWWPRLWQDLHHAHHLQALAEDVQKGGPVCPHRCVSCPASSLTQIISSLQGTRMAVNGIAIRLVVFLQMSL